ncbi:hypothetical protein CRYPA_428 [uncultured Candidatus Thioglobus sp.]|nr:hypothetical protein CRYPA_428 [uncultured Candidatus Thioglobus sp.]
MKNLTKGSFVTLMLIGLFSTNTFAAVDCTGFKVKYNPETIVWQGGLPSGELGRCQDFNKSGATWSYVDERSGEIRYQNQKWDGVRRYEGADNSSVSSIQASIPKVEIVAKKSNGQDLSESFGFYIVLEKYGMKNGLNKIKLFFASYGGRKENHNDVISYLSNVSWATIQYGAKEFKMDIDLQNFLRA